jgi:hypothetical protein
MVPLSICSFIEVSLACICASLATLRPLLQKLGLGSRSLVAAASDGGEARGNRWEGLGSDSAAASADGGKKGEMEVFAWSGGGREGEGVVEMVVLGFVPAKVGGREVGAVRTVR